MPRTVFSRDEALALAKERGHQERVARLKAVRKQEDAWARQVRQRMSHRITSLTQRLTDDSKCNFELEQNDHLARLVDLTDDLQHNIDARNEEFMLESEQAKYQLKESQKTEADQKIKAKKRGSIALNREMMMHQQRDALSRQRAYYQRKANEYGHQIRQQNQQSWLFNQGPKSDDSLMNDNHKSQVFWSRNEFGVLCRSKKNERVPLVQTHPLNTVSHFTTATDQVSFVESTSVPIEKNEILDSNMEDSPMNRAEQKLFPFDPFGLEYFVAKREKNAELMKQQRKLKSRKKQKRSVSQLKMQSIPENGLLQNNSMSDDCIPLMNAYQRAQVESENARLKAEEFSTAVEVKSHQRAIDALKEVRRDKQAERLSEELNAQRIQHKLNVMNHYTQVMKNEQSQREKSLESEFEDMFGKSDEQCIDQSSGIEADVDEEEFHRREIPVPLLSKPTISGSITVSKGWFESLLSELPHSLKSDIVENTKNGVSVDKELLEKLVSQLKRARTESAVGIKSSSESQTQGTTGSQSTATMVAQSIKEEVESVDVTSFDEESQLLSDINIDNIERKQNEFKQRIDALMIREQELEKQLNSDDQRDESSEEADLSSVNLSRISSVPSLRESFFEQWKDESIMADNNDSDEWTLSSVQSENMTALIKQELRDKVDDQFSSVLTDTDFDRLTKAVINSELEEYL